MKKQKFLCSTCAYNWRGCHNPARPNVTPEQGCKDYWRKGRRHEPDLNTLSEEWVSGLDLRGLGKKKRPKKR